MKINIKCFKYFFLILSLSVFVTFFNLKLKKALGLNEAGFGDKDFFYSMFVDMLIFYSAKAIYYMVDIKELV